MTLAELIGPDASNPGESAGYWQAVREWSMGGNDKYGDCAFVSLCNLIDLVTAVNGAPELVGEAEAEYFYAQEAGFNSQNPATDKGAVLEDVIRYWSDHGWPSDPTVKPVGWCAIEPDQIHQAIYALGGVPAWCVLPVDADGDPDFSDEADPASAVDGHAFLIVGSGPSGYRIVSWAQIYDISHAWAERFIRGQFAVHHPAWKPR